MNAEEISMALEESDLDLNALLEKAVARRNAALRAEAEKLRQEREAAKAAVEEEISLCLVCYQGAVKDALADAILRQKEGRYVPNQQELDMISEKIPFRVDGVRSTTWRFFSPYHSFEIRKARNALSKARAKLKRFV